MSNFTNETPPQKGPKKGLCIVIGCFVVLLVGVIALSSAIKSALKEFFTETAEHALTETLFGGGQKSEGADLYGQEHLIFEFDTPNPEGAEGAVTVVGTVRNNGDREVTYLKLTVRLMDDQGTQVGGGDDLIAHGLPIGENNTPIRAHSAKKFTIHVAKTYPGWKKKLIEYDGYKTCLVRS